MHTDDVITHRKLTPCELHDVTLPVTQVNHLALIFLVVRHGDASARSRFHFVWVPRCQTNGGS